MRGGPRHRGHRPHRFGGPPHWWPHGERWPPGPPWQGAPRRFRRRFLLVAFAGLALLLWIGFMVGLLVDGKPGPPDDRGDERRPGALVAVGVGVLIVGGAATGLAYRRLSRPLAELMGAAERVADGDYAVAVSVEPQGPRELRMLTRTFNEMAVRLAATEDQRRRFLADVTHELRTPLAVLQSGLEAQLDGLRPRDDAHVTSLLDETRRLGQLVEDLHTLALAEAGRLTLHTEPTDVGALVDDAVRAHAALAERAQVDVTAQVADDVPVLTADPTRLRQVLDNLLANALRHTPAGGAVDVRVRRQADGDADGDAEAVVVTVADSGPGIAPGDLDLVFDRFSRSTGSRSSGLGLAIVRDLVEAHGGRVHAENQPTGGAVLHVTLPVAGPPT